MLVLLPLDDWEGRCGCVFECAVGPVAVNRVASAGERMTEGWKWDWEMPSQTEQAVPLLLGSAALLASFKVSAIMMRTKSTKCMWR